MFDIGVCLTYIISLKKVEVHEYLNNVVGLAAELLYLD